jgi:hypothetical protein
MGTVKPFQEKSRHRPGEVEKGNNTKWEKGRKNNGKNNSNGKVHKPLDLSYSFACSKYYIYNVTKNTNTSC